MQSLRIVSLAALALAIMPAVPSAYAQDKAKLKVQIPFEFVARGKSFQRGTYTFTASQGSITLADAEGKGSLVLPIITFLARSHADDDHLLAFDKVQGKRILSEIWLPEREGALVDNEKGEHAHEVLRVVPQRKR